MPRIQLGEKSRRVHPKHQELVRRLAEEITRSSDSGQPLLYEQEYATGKKRVTVIWDEWHLLPLDERSAIIWDAYKVAEGPASRDRIALASGLTVPEAQTNGILPYQILPTVRKTDPITLEQAREAMIQEGASTLVPDSLQLRFATVEEAEACVKRLIARLPTSEPIWIINWEIPPQEMVEWQDSMQDNS